jgi:ABC-type antimicrobial peptide transport system permease subunit
MARHYFAGDNALGKHVTFNGEDRPYEIIGVVGDAKYSELREPAPHTIYLNAFQAHSTFSQFAIRTDVPPAAIANQVRRTMRETLAAVSVTSVTTLTDQVNASIVPERLLASLSGVFGALGIALAAIGLYGLLAYTVVRRSNEIGVRMALGATRNDVFWMVVTETLAMIGGGLAIGVPVAYMGKNFAAGMLPGLPSSSAVPITFSALAIVTAALFTAYVPARRAAAADPMEALRHD